MHGTVDSHNELQLVHCCAKLRKEEKIHTLNSDRARVTRLHLPLRVDIEMTLDRKISD